MNRLANSLSPYLLQHRDNPVDWYPWGDEAFTAASKSDRPLFLSIGYAACHWCHVMAHESFENESVAKFLNDHFVSIKVDREERPDIDQIYMNAVQMMTGRGGWPMSVFLDHDRKPFYAGTYLPPTQKFGMPGFSQVLDALVDAWNNRRDEVKKHSSEITAALEKLATGTTRSADSVPNETVIKNATEHLLCVLDRTDGGFERAPKFPHATDLDLLLRRGLTKSQPDLIAAAELTLDRMAGGGIYDSIAARTRIARESKASSMSGSLLRLNRYWDLNAPRSFAKPMIFLRQATLKAAAFQIYAGRSIHRSSRMIVNRCG